MKTLVKYKFSIVISIGILYLSLFKPPEIDSPLLKIENIDKYIHIIMYATLSLAMALESNNKWRKYLPVFLISTIFGGVIEILQKFAPPRTASWGDFLADAIGSALPLVILTIIYLISYARHRKSNADCPEPGGRDRVSKS